MLDFNTQPNIMSATDTAQSGIEGRLKVGFEEKKRKIIKKHLKKQKHGKNKEEHS